MSFANVRRVLILASLIAVLASTPSVRAEDVAVPQADREAIEAIIKKKIADLANEKDKDGIGYKRGTFSKSFGMMGWRVGFLVADAAVCAHAVKIQDAMIICAPVISQMAALGAVSEDWDYPMSFHGALLERRETLARGVRMIPHLHWTPTGAGFFGFIRVDGCRDSAALAESVLEEAHVVTIPGAAFGRSGEGHLRLSYGAVPAADVAEAMRRLAAYFERHGPD